MNEGSARDIVEQLGGLYAEGVLADDEARATHDATLARLLTNVPEPNSWTVVRRGAGSALMLADNLMFMLAIDRVDAEGHPDALLTSRWLEGPTTAVSVRWDAHHESEGSSGYTTHWTFQLSDGDSIALVGFVQTAPGEGLDRTEAFARSVARKVGWRLAG